MLADAEVQVSPAVGAALDAVGAHQGQRRGSEIGGAADEGVGHELRSDLEDLLGGLAGRHLGARLELLEEPGGELRHAPLEDPLELGGELRVGIAVGEEALLPLVFGQLAGFDRGAEVRQGLRGDVEGGLERPAVELLGQRDLLRAQRRAVSPGAVLLVG
jgi:hypothetical protein